MTLPLQFRDTNRQFNPTDMLPFIKSIKAEKPVQLKSLEIKVSVTGIYAETTQVMHFYNPNKRAFSGELVFPLPENAVVCGYALDIDGIMRDGVVVPKQEARKILEAEERKGADPGLVEQVQGNVYKIRIYPFQPKGTRTVSITYITELTVSGNEAAYHLPLSHAGQVEEFAIRVEVNQAPCPPEITGGQGNMTLTSWHQAWVAEAKLTKGLVTEDLLIRLPDLPAELVMVESTEDGECFFCISTVSREKVAVDKWVAKNIAIAWDASGSRAQIERDFEFLKALFESWQTLSVHVQIFRNQIEEQIHVFEIRGGDPTELVQFLKSLPYDGATDLASLDFSSFPIDECEAWFLFSDGMDTVNGILPVVSDKRVYTINSSQKGNAPYLEYLADQSGGAYINLLNTKPKEAVTQICSITPITKIISSFGCEDINIRTGMGRTNITGRLEAETGSISLQYPDLSEVELVIVSANSSKGRLIGRQWAGQQIQKLSLTQTSQDEQLLILARRFGLVSSETSLLVLDTVEQYVDYRVEPPASLPEMREEYWDAIKGFSEDRDEKKKAHLEDVARMWESRVEWWEKEFASNSKKPINRQNESQRTLRRVSADELPPSFFAESCRDYALDISDADSFGREGGHECYSPDEPDLALQSHSNTENFEEDHGAEATISIKPWNPDTPYITKLIKAEPSDRYQIYLKLCSENKNSPSFYLDCGDHFLKQDQKVLGIRILSNLLESGLEDAALMRIYAWRLQQAEELDAAITIFERVLALRDDEPQSHRDLALVLGSRWKRDGKEDDIIRAMQLLYEVVSNEWNRFPEIEIIALMELNRLIYLAKQKSINIPEYIDKRLIRNLDLDLRISMSWDADLTDVDLHVFEPTGEHAYYAHNLTDSGGLVSMDFREGYGPEEYVLRKAVPGSYKIKAHYFGSHQQTICGPCTVTVTVFTNYGRADESRQVLTLRLDASGDDHLVGEVEIAGAGKQKAKTTFDELIAPFKKLRQGMTIDEVTSLVGQPQEIERDEENMEIVLNYMLQEKVTLQVCLGPELTRVRQVVDGACIDLNFST
ncbi:VIT domain-containing protein [Desulfopila sp. IMCC35006]|uniref:VIT domain-containing protein n=1 Tax=Desulfopila sp. IMCC35006 TaxID=2569542 RepID=UPI00142ED8A4|nr:VIT domain-containing protein [Desulfopila sp. IMCC35006]